MDENKQSPSLDEELGIEVEDQKIEEDENKIKQDTDNQVSEVEEENSDLKVSEAQQKINEIQDSISELSEDLKQLEESKKIVEENKEIGLDATTAKTVTITVERIYNKYNKILPISKQIRKISKEGFDYSSTRIISTEGLLDSISSAGKAAWEFIVKLINKLIDAVKVLWEKLFNKSKIVSKQVENTVKQNEELIKQIDDKKEEDLFIEFEALPATFKTENFNTIKELNDKVRTFQTSLSDFLKDIIKLFKVYENVSIFTNLENPKYPDSPQFNIKKRKDFLFGLSIEIDTYEGDCGIGKSITGSPNTSNKKFSKQDIQQVNVILKSLDDEIKYLINEIKELANLWNIFAKSAEQGIKKIHALSTDGLDVKKTAERMIVSFNRKVNTITELIQPNVLNIIFHFIRDYSILCNRLHSKVK